VVFAALGADARHAKPFLLISDVFVLTVVLHIRCRPGC
jgi:hypothetical protein